MGDRQAMYWLLDSPVQSNANVVKFGVWTHHDGRSVRVMWAGQLAAMTPGGDIAGAFKNPQVQLYGVRLGRYIADAGTLEQQGFQEGDVFVLLADNQPQWEEYLQAVRPQLPVSFPVDLPIKEPHRLEEVERMVHESKRRDVPGIIFQGPVHNPIISQAFDNAKVVINGSGVSPDVKALITQLTDVAKRLVESGQIDEEAAEIISDDVEKVATEISKPAEERRVSVLRRALDDLLIYGEKASAVGLPLIDLVTKLQATF